MIDTIYGPQKFPNIPDVHWDGLKITAIRSPIQYYTLQGHISENRMIQYLLTLPKISKVRKIPDYADGHGGDVEFTYRKRVYTMEIKTLSLTDGKGVVSVVPTRKSDDVHAYRADGFDLIGVCISSRIENALIFARTTTYPRHKKNDLFLQGRMTLQESKHFAPFTFDLLSLL